MWRERITVAAVGTTLALLFVSVRTSDQGGRNEPDGREKRSWSGRSYLDQTVVEAEPRASVSAKAFESERVWSGRDDWEPALAADPSSSYVYQLTTRYDGPKPCGGCPLPAIVFRRSSDSGATWEADKFLIATKKKQNDPQIEVASDGALYAVWMDDYSPGVKFIKSTNRGNTWSSPIAFTGKGRKPSWSDRPILAISSSGRDVYVAFNASDSYIVASHDYGRTFGTAVKTNSDARYWFHTAGAVAQDGTAYFVATDFSQDYTGDADINVIRSSDGGITWQTTRIDTSREMPDCPWAAGCYFGFLGPSAGVAADSTGAVVVAYNAGQTVGAPQRMWARRSADGLSWSGRVELSDEASTANNVFPAVASSTTAGDFRVAWQDDRRGATSAWNTWYRRSTDGGRTWSTPMRVSDLGSGAPYKSETGYRFPYGDYLEITVDATGRTHMIWGEGDSYDGPGGSWYTRSR